MGICCVAVLLIFLCGVVVKKIPTCSVAVISNHTVYSISNFKPTVLYETKQLADPLPVLPFIILL